MFCRCRFSVDVFLFVIAYLLVQDFLSYIFATINMLVYSLRSFCTFLYLRSSIFYSNCFVIRWRSRLAQKYVHSTLSPCCVGSLHTYSPGIITDTAWKEHFWREPSQAVSSRSTVPPNSTPLSTLHLYPSEIKAATHTTGLNAADFCARI